MPFAARSLPALLSSGVVVCLLAFPGPARLAAQAPPPPPSTSQPTTAADYVSVARQALAARQSRGAIQWFDGALKLDPAYGPALFGMADTYRLMGQNSQAKRFFELYIRGEAGRNDPKAHLGLALCLQQSDYHILAIKSFREALTLDPGSADAMMSLALSLRARHENEEAATWARAAAAAAPNAHRTRHVLALVAQSRHEYGEAAREMNRAIQLVREAMNPQPGDLRPLRQLQAYYGSLRGILTEQGRANVKAGQPDSGVVHDLNLVMEQLAHIEHSLKMFDVLAVAQEAARLSPAEVRIMTRLAELQSRLGLAPIAAETWEAVLQLDPSHEAAKDWLARYRASTQPATAPAQP